MSETTALALRPQNPNVLSVRDIYADGERAFKFARALAIGSGGSESDAMNALAKMVIGAELGIGAGAAVRGLHFIKGRIAMSADLMVAMLREDGWSTVIEHSTPPGSWCKFSAKRGDEAYSFTWTIEMAKQAGLSGDNWRKYPWDMLYARAASHVARKCAPGRLHGMYDVSELTEAVDVPNDSRPVPEVRESLDEYDDEVVDVDAEPASNAPTPEELAEIQPELYSEAGRA